MLVAERHELLLAQLAAQGKVVAKDIAAELAISEDTIRRDLRELASVGLCQRVYGGALPVSPAVADYATRQTVALDSKQLVAKRARSLIEPGMTVLIDGGTTALAVVQALDQECMVITHSPTIACALLDRPAVDVFLLGGRLFRHSAVTCGAATVEAAQSVSADLFLLGVTGVHPDEGLTTGDAEEAAMKRALAARAADTYVLASAEKIGTASRYRVLAAREVAGIITDVPADHPVVRRLQNDDVTVLHAS
ncbi:DeoR/GlpR family DNA-binding transcription regulator [Kutzneria sp. CA-103260]|uniref:DeoR/GlpR family DNA-binding transcription regulator n=1 Tax=Kutzneria sp. CA-103260 TaxID=2802641 RepID=UPI001BA9064A|nr:DeoR/GlpR family DNA-binding transcription regulator [Kutzneria sp. CA-103260]QUQ71917.1 DeoR family transcriptional regulator [Kutzneria sp. CA-103260]